MKTFLLPCALTVWIATAPKAAPTHNAITATMLVRINPSLGLCFVEKKPPRPGLVVAVACGFAVPPETWPKNRRADAAGQPLWICYATFLRHRQCQTAEPKHAEQAR